MKREMVKTTLYIEKSLLKKVKMMVINKEKTNVESVSHAANYGLEEIVKRGKI